MEYKKILRLEGDGEIRIVKSLQLREDMYGLTLVSYFNDEILDETKALEFDENKVVEIDKLDVSKAVKSDSQVNDDEYNESDADDDY